METSPNKKHKAVTPSPPDPKRSLPLHPSSMEAMFSDTDDQSRHNVSESMSSSTAWPSFSADSFSSYTTVATSFNAQESMQQEKTFSQPEASVANPSRLKFTSGNFPSKQQKPQLPFFERILNNQDVLFEVCRWLPAKDLINLYAISKQFHFQVNQRITTLIVGNAESRMPESAEVFHFKGYKSLCIFDPAQNESEDKEIIVRDTPSLRWLSFIEHRETTVYSIIVQLALKGHRLPRCTSKVIKKIWFLMDIPDTKRRIGTVHNTQIWSNVELFLACMFFMKLDMSCTDPILGPGQTQIRAMLLAQRSLTVMDKVLKREMMRNQYEILQMTTEWSMDRVAVQRNLTEGEEIRDLFFGVQPEHIGRLRCESWIAGAGDLMRPDELVLKESIRRGLQFRYKLSEMILWGNVHPVTLVDVFPKNWRGEVQTSFEDEVEEKIERDIAQFVSQVDYIDGS